MTTTTAPTAEQVLEAIRLDRPRRRTYSCGENALDIQVGGRYGHLPLAEAEARLVRASWFKWDTTFYDYKLHVYVDGQSQWWDVRVPEQ